MSLGINIPEYEVSQFNALLKEVIESNFDYVRIRGEISDLKNAASGHIYLTLKDQNSVLNATIWNNKTNFLKIMPEVGMEVIVTGKISTYAKSISTYSINIDNIELAGEGALLKLIEDRKKRLEKQGIFDLIHKKKLPYLPNKIGVITSSTGSVIHDILNRIRERFPIDVDLWPVSVQGANAVENIMVAIQGFNSRFYESKPDIIIIARGGGSTEDLMPFNDEKLALAVFDSSIPIISAVGHETDTTIIDYVSDLRASTPTAAAEKTVPLKSELIQNLQNISHRLDTSSQNMINLCHSDLLGLSKSLRSPDLAITAIKDKFETINQALSKDIKNYYQNKLNKFFNVINLLRSPKDLYENKKNLLKSISKEIERIIIDKQRNQKRELNKFNRLLESNSLYKNLNKGYSVIRKSKKIINKSNLINEEDLINIQFLDTAINIKVKKIN